MKSNRSFEICKGNLKARLLQIISLGNFCIIGVKDDYDQCKKVDIFLTKVSLYTCFLYFVASEYLEKKKKKVIKRSCTSAEQVLIEDKNRSRLYTYGWRLQLVMQVLKQILFFSLLFRLSVIRRNWIPSAEPSQSQIMLFGILAFCSILTLTIFICVSRTP